VCTQAARWTANESLAVFILRLAKMFRFDPDVTNPDSPANRTAADWYRNNRNSGWFPTDTVRLPMIEVEIDDDDFTILNTDFSQDDDFIYHS
jgi:hypothetical protein